jgi:hypothetical protein
MYHESEMYENRLSISYFKTDNAGYNWTAGWSEIGQQRKNEAVKRKLI